MKNIFLTLSVILFTFISCGDNPYSKDGKVDPNATTTANATTAAEQPKTEMSFDRVLHDFGSINNGERQETTFTYTNTGDKPLIVTDIKSTCGCTVPKNWNKSPLAPGESSTFTVNFDGKGANKVSKTINVFANTPKTKESVRITAFINNPNAVKQQTLPNLNK